MADRDKAYFRELAERLRVEALDLQSRAGRGELRSAHEALSRITSTCDSCHTAFRIMPLATGHGPIE
jgi:hypothetical protein